MVNISMLRGKIVENETNVTDIAEKMGIDKATLYRRMSDASSFTIKEAMQIKDILHLSNEEAISIFFN